MQVTYFLLFKTRTGIYGKLYIPHNAVDAYKSISLPRILWALFSLRALLIKYLS